MKINTNLNYYWYGAAPIEAMNALMSNLQKRGVMYLQTGNCFEKFPAGGGFQINAPDTYVQFTPSVDGVTVGTQTVSGTGPVPMPWATSSPGNGSHQITATVRDATGNTASASMTVMVAN
ncbi:MAG TPA: hypothetical protein VFW70_18825 [Methylomirabilota bacterium]|nr:hypothetical protein [Methylomirabilota bacterium]